MKKIAVLLTCFNRREQSLACLEQVYSSQGVSADVILVDDGSTDGTAETVQEKYPQVQLLKGDGQLFWNRGMHKAFAAALDKGYDYYLWLNDDTELYPDTLERLQRESESLEDKAILVGSACDPQTKQLTYGGVVRASKTAPLRFKLVEPGETRKPCDTINGNCVLIPEYVAQRLGNLDPYYQHGMGDFDYGLRAQKHGLACFIVPGFIGECAKNPVENSWLDKQLSFRERWKKATSLKGLPIRDWKYFARNYAGLLWPIYFASPYIRLMLKMR